MAPALPTALGKITLAIHKASLKLRGTTQVALTPFFDLRHVVITSRRPTRVPPRAPVYGIMQVSLPGRREIAHGRSRGESDLCLMEESRQRYVVDEDIQKVDPKNDPWLTLDFEASLSDPPPGQG